MTRRVITRVESLPIGEEESSAAGKLAAARAVAALVSETGGVMLRSDEVEIINTDDGAPRAVSPRLKDGEVRVSITHTRTNAHGMAAVEDADD